MKESAAPLTDRQRAVLSAIVDYRKATGEVPPLMYLARHLQLHHSTVQQHVGELHRKGFLRAAVPGPPLRELQPLPIPVRDEDDGPVPTIEERTITSPLLPEPVKVEKHTLPGQPRPSVVVMKTRTRRAQFTVLRDDGPNGQITGFDVVEEVEG